MDTWRAGRGSLLSEVSKVYDQIGARLEAELDEANLVRVSRSEWIKLQEESAHAHETKAENARLVIELERCKAAMGRAAELDKENERLKRDLEAAIQRCKQLEKPAAETPTPTLKDDPFSSDLALTPGVKSTSKTVSGDRFNELATRSNKLFDNWQHEKTKKEQWRDKCNRQRETLEQWKAVIEEHKAAIRQKDSIISKLRGEKVGLGAAVVSQTGSTLDANSLRPTSSMPATTKANSLVVIEHPQPLVETAIMGTPPDGTSHRMEDAHNPSNPRILSIADSQGEDSLEDSPEEELSLPQLPRTLPQSTTTDTSTSTTTDENIGPEMDSILKDNKVLSRTTADLDESPEFVSARRVKKRKLRHDTTNASPKRKVKIEVSSSPTGLDRRVHSSDSLDLDDIGEKTDTPKKQRRLLELARGRRALSDESQSPKTESQKRNLNRLRAVSEQISQETPVRRVGRSRPALQTLSANKQVVPSNTDSQTKKRRRVAYTNAVNNLIEDGELEIPPPTNKVDKGEKIASLLSEKSPTKVVLSPLRQPGALHSPARKSRRAAVSVYSEPERQDELEQTVATVSRPASRGAVTRVSTLDRASARAVQDQREARSTTHTPAPPSTSTKRSLRDVTSARKGLQPGQKSLRDRPVASLRLEDFKINPSYNQGYDYAFGEVVRDRNARQHLQGCTKPECCGNQFRALALTSMRNPNVPATASQEEADEELLEEFLGDNYYKVKNMSKAERDEVLVKAKTRDLANKHGKHRHAYERPSSPPGFWRADFPTTQEEMEDRARAEEELRNQVQQRYEEAMRSNGRYMFRDE